MQSEREIAMSGAAHHQVVSREEWLTQRRALLDREKEHMRHGDRLAAERRALPWVRIDKTYLFDTPNGRKSLGDLFAGQSQLIVHHLMFHPDWDAACVGCSFQAEHIDGALRHLAHHDVSVVAVSRAPLVKLEAYKRRMGWQFPWVSSLGNDFNCDFGVTFSKDQVAAGRIDYNFGTITIDARYVAEELPGVSVFAKDESGQLFHTYSTYARGLDALLGTHHYADLTPKGRSALDSPDALRRHDEYESKNPW
jgi:predicted dithiol-disulfide oxidoreductase (DUF899 family)